MTEPAGGQRIGKAAGNRRAPLPQKSVKGILDASIKRTTIVCTLGPSTRDDDVLRELIRSGMSVARLNFSHGTYDEHRAMVEQVRRIAKELNAAVAIMVDTKGPEIRTGLTTNHEPVALVSGETITITTHPVPATKERFSLDYQSLPQEVEPGSRIFVDDGLIGLEVLSVSDDEILCRVTNGGFLAEHRGVNVPNVVTSLPSVTEQDRRDLRFACELQVDAVAVSFVRDASAVREVRDLCGRFGCADMLVFSKIESALAVGHFDEILDESDGIMVARGDLGVEMPPAEVPRLQKDIIAKCNRAYKPVITATQMLDSMIRNPRPTRAEVNDVANAIYDGTDCVMLSGETAAGAYPVQSVRTMAEICMQTERYLSERFEYHDRKGMGNVSGATCYSAVEMARRVDAVAILCPTNSGRTARIVSGFRPRLPIFATSQFERTVRRVQFYWGVEGILAKEQEGLARTCYDALRTVMRAGYIQFDDIVVITAGDPLSSPLTGDTNTNTNVCMIAQALL